MSDVRRDEAGEFPVRLVVDRAAEISLVADEAPAQVAGMSWNRESVDCRLRGSIDQGADGAWPEGTHDLLEKPGDFVWIREGGVITHIFIFLPGNEGGTRSPWPVVKGEFPGHGQRNWGWDGNEEKPTLSPSLWCNKAHEYEHEGVKKTVEHPNEWHGNLEAGFLRSA